VFRRAQCSRIKLRPLVGCGGAAFIVLVRDIDGAGAAADP
jgi:hypothetical protein